MPLGRSQSINRFVWYLKTNSYCGWFSNGKISYFVLNHLKIGPVFRTEYVLGRLIYHSKTRRVCLIFKCHLNTRPFDFINQQFEYRRHPKPKWSFWTGPYHLIGEHSKSRRCVRISNGASLDCFTNKVHKKIFYSCQNGLG
jgi:hypothetical protein